MTFQWPPNYTVEYGKRLERLKRIRADPVARAGAWEFYRTHPAEFIEDWCDTVDPRKASDGLPTRMPFILFPKQRELVEFLWCCIQDRENGLVEKARDMGATWVCCAFSVWLWVFHPGASVGWGSRKEQLVDRLGDMDSIFEKIRTLIRDLPPEFLPAGFSPKEHATFMKVVHPDPVNGAAITGEAGDNIGRGGRKTIYFKDESAHYERPELIEAALADNTNTQIDISSVNGTGNVFYRRRESGVVWPDTAPRKTRVFVMDWRDHPAKSQDWYDARRQKAEDDGLLHKFAQEVDRDYSSAVAGIIIKPEWVKAAIDAHKVLGFDDSGQWVSSLDVADDGTGDRNAQAARKGVVLRFLDEWGQVDTTVTASKAIDNCRSLTGRNDFVLFQYDGIGVGAGVKGETNRLKRDGGLPANVNVIPWIASASPLDAEKPLIPGDKNSPLNEDLFTNLKAQAWFQVARRFERTYKAVMAHRGTGPAFKWEPDDLISIPAELPRRLQLERELSQATMGQGSRLKMVVNKTPDGNRSPNLADSVVMTYWPVKGKGGLTLDALRKVLS